MCTAFARACPQVRVFLDTCADTLRSMPTCTCRRTDLRPPLMCCTSTCRQRGSCAQGRSREV
eukprot:6881976-Alexandrium_andersonii.AAC.1